MRYAYWLWAVWPVSYFGVNGLLLRINQSPQSSRFAHRCPHFIRTLQFLWWYRVPRQAQYRRQLKSRLMWTHQAWKFQRFPLPVSILRLRSQRLSPLPMFADESSHLAERISSTCKRSRWSLISGWQLIAKTARFILRLVTVWVSFSVHAASLSD